MTEAPEANNAEPQSIEDALRAALADHRAGRHAEAGRWYRRILSIEPCVPDALHLLGLLAREGSTQGQAEALIRRAIHLDARAALYWFNLSTVLSDNGDADGAAICCERALDLDPRHLGAARNLARMRIRLAATPDLVEKTRRRWGTQDAALHHPVDSRRLATGPGTLLIRGWGCGFWGEVNHVAVQLALADIMGREPIVYWGSELRYRPPGVENAWEAYFEPVSAASATSLDARDESIFPGQWTAANLLTSQVRALEASAQVNIHGVSALAGLNRPEPVVIADGYNEMSDVLAWAAPRHPLAGLASGDVYRRIYASKIRLRRDLRAKIDELSQDILIDRPVISVHFRAQHHDKQGEALEKISISLNDYFFILDKFVKEHPSSRVFLITDLASAMDAFRARYGDRLIGRPRQRLSHADQFDLGLDHSRNGHQLAIEVLEDAYLAAACDYFLGDGASGVSCTVVALKDWPAGHARLLRRNVFTDRRGATTL